VLDRLAGDHDVEGAVGEAHPGDVLDTGLNVSRALLGQEVCGLLHRDG